MGSSCSRELERQEEERCSYSTVITRGPLRVPDVRGGAADGDSMRGSVSGEAHLEMGAYSMRCALPGRRLRQSRETPAGLQHTAAPVMLHIYNIGKSVNTQLVNSVLRKLGTGAFHCGVEVYGCEWSFSDVICNDPDIEFNPRTLSGIFCCRPRNCEGHSYFDSVPMGTTRLGEVEVMKLIELLRSQWTVSSYSTLRNNCCHFSNELCHRLGVGSIPEWVKNLAGAGAAVAAAGDTICCRSMATQSYFCCGEGEKAGSHVGSSSRRDTDDEDALLRVVDALPVLPSVRHVEEAGWSQRRSSPAPSSRGKLQGRSGRALRATL